eukprot:scaffold91841_cov53-Phaeocystis_antarctica.AAC.2
MKSRVTPVAPGSFGLVSRRAFCEGDVSAGKLSATAGYGPIHRSGALSAIGPSSSEMAGGGGGGGSGSAARQRALNVSISISIASASRDARSACSASRSASARRSSFSAEQASEGAR